MRELEFKTLMEEAKKPLYTLKENIDCSINEVFEKQLAMPVYDADIQDEEAGKCHIGYLCPRCHKILYTFSDEYNEEMGIQNMTNAKYCPDCGQRLKW